MSRDKSKFLSWKPVENGNVTFGNNEPGKIVGKCIVSLANGRGKANNVLFVNGLKHNILSVSEMCDQGYDVFFKAKNCQVNYAGMGKIVVEVVEININAYVLREKTKRCCLS